MYASNRATIPRASTFQMSSLSLRCLYGLHEHARTTGQLTLRDVQEWISEREDVATFLSNFTEARFIISSTEVVPDALLPSRDSYSPTLYCYRKVSTTLTTDLRTTKCNNCPFRFVYHMPRRNSTTHVDKTSDRAKTTYT